MGGQRLPLHQAERRAPPAVRDELDRLRKRLKVLEDQLSGERERFIRQAAPQLMAGAMAATDRWKVGDETVTTGKDYARLAKRHAERLAAELFPGAPDA